jgi:DNA repair exonuclease SbcCD nuclease subunit
MNKQNKLKKAAVFTDLHYGRKSNSDQHNQDCINFLEWFCSEVKKDPEIDHIIFMGDWHENRSALNISTMLYSFKGAKIINNLGLPVYFIVGNHDLYYRHTRDIHSLFHFSSLSNFNIIDEPTVCEDTYKPILLCPYLFHHEYVELSQYLKLPIWFGHFEFQGFMITGYNNVMPTGPNCDDFKEPKHIFSGHFHKRQANKNVVYIGNTFPMDFSDAGDTSRGMTTYDYVNDKIEFIDWGNCPKYTKTSLSSLVDGKTILLPESRVKCVADIALSYEEVSVLRQTFIESYKLRELVIEDSDEIANVISGTEIDIDTNELMTISDMMLQLLSSIDTEHIDNEMLIEIYKSLKV